jgi:hypothetical protein
MVEIPVLRNFGFTQREGFMPEFSKESRIGARSIPAITDRLFVAHATVSSSRGPVWTGSRRRMPLEVYINAVLLDWLDTPQAEQEARLRVALAKLDALIAEPESATPSDVLVTATPPPGKVLIAPPVLTRAGKVKPASKPGRVKRRA